MQAKLEHEIKETFDPYIDDDPEPYIGIICIPMPTALAHIFSEDGLVIAADGFSFIRTSEGLKRESLRIQKIFNISGTNRVVACSFLGRVTLLNDTDKKVFSFISACQKAAKAVESLPTRDASEFAARICPLVLKDLASVKQKGELSRYPNPVPLEPGELGRTLVRTFVDGYFNGQPYRTGIRLYHVDQELGWDLRWHDLSRWHKSLFYGSMGVADLLFGTEDPRLKNYRTNACRLVAIRRRHPETGMPLSDAIEAARNFIGACSDPVAQEIDGQDYQRIGGELQLATITPTEGFQWKFRPEEFDLL